MPIQTDSLNRKLYELLKSQGYNPIPKDSEGQTTPVPDESEVFQMAFNADGNEYGKVWITIDSSQNLIIYYDDNVTASDDDTGGRNWSRFLQQMKNWAQRRQLSFELKNKNHLASDMAQRSHMKKKEQIAEGYYPMGKAASYSDAVPTVKIVLQHTRQIQEGEQRFRNIARIFLENQQGERILAPTNRPGIAQVYARHLAEGGLPHDDRWNHIGSLVEEYSKMAGFVRATRGGQFNESAQQLVNEGINHYNSLRETLGKMRGHRGYQSYFESYTPPLMEDDSDDNTINELFVQETLDPRIESVMPILAKLHKKVNEMREVKELEEWATSLTEMNIEEEVGDVRDLEDFKERIKNIKKMQMTQRADPTRNLAKLKQELIKKAKAKGIDTSSEELEEDLGPEQKKVGQLGPTEKVKNNNIGTLVGANESIEKGVAEGSRIKTPSGMYLDQHTGVAYSKPTGQDGHDSYMTPAYMLDHYKKRLAQIAAGPYKRPKEVAQLQSRIAKLEKQGVAEGMLDNPGEQDSPVAQAIIRRILLQRTDLLAKYGPERVGQAVDEVADFVGDVDEIGSSDVSGWIRHVEQMLGNMNEQGVAEGWMSSDEPVSWEKGGTRAPTGALGSNKLKGTPVVSLSDFGDEDTKKNKYGQTVPKKLSKDDPRVKFHKDQKQGVAEGEVVPFRRPQAQPLSWEQLPKDVLRLANDWYWAAEDDSGLDAVTDRGGFGNGTTNELKYITAKLQQLGWNIDFNDEHDGPGEYNLRLTNKRGQTVLLSIEDAQDFTGWAKGTRDISEQGVAEGYDDRKTAPGWHSDSVKNPNFNDELSGRRVSPPGQRLKSGKLSADERGSQERTKTLMKFKKAQGGLTGPKGVLPEQGVNEGKFTVNARTGAKLDPRTGAELPPKEKPLTMKQMFAAPKKPAMPKLTLDDVWRKVESVVSQIYPDGDPIDWLGPWFRKQGIADHKVGDILERAARKNGYKDIYDYYNSFGDDLGLEEGLADDFIKLAQQKGMNARLRGTPEQERERRDAMLAQRAATPAAKPVEDVAVLKQELATLEKQLDPNYEYSDDYSVWHKNNQIAKQIASLKQRISSQGPAELSEDNDDLTHIKRLLGK